jgi:hypothetical protein
MINGEASASHSCQPTVGVTSLSIPLCPIKPRGCTKGIFLNDCNYNIHRFWVLLSILYVCFMLQRPSVAKRGAWGAHTCIQYILENSIVSLLFAPISCVVHIDCMSPMQCLVKEAQMTASTHCICCRSGVSPSTNEETFHSCLLHQEPTSTSIN